MNLSQDFKEKHVDHKFVMCFLPYLFGGFKIHRAARFVAESNVAEDMRTFVEILFRSRRMLFTSFLCAHRDAKSGDGLNLLQSFIPAEKIRRAASLVLALAHNACNTTAGEILFLQQNVSAYATSSIFPEVTVAYLENGRAHEMIDRLRYQYDLVGQVLRDLPAGGIRARVVSLDILTWRLEAFLNARFGEAWRQRDFSFIEGQSDPLVEIAMQEVLPSIKRMMPFFSGNVQPNFLARQAEIVEKNRTAALEVGGEKLATMVEQVVGWFMKQHSMTITAKAVQEASFYYLWGKYCGKSSQVFAIGFDRDHESYQYRAWKLGAESNRYRFGAHMSAPLYARRNPNGREHGALSDLSFRQFWR